MKKLVTKIVMIILCIFITGCAGRTEKDKNNLGTLKLQAEEKDNLNYETDRAGNDVILPEKVDKIISLAPSITQVLLELGVKDKLIAVDTQSPLYADLAQDIPKYDMMTPDIEDIMDIQPDMIFVSSMGNLDGEDMYAPVRKAGICVIEIPTAASIEEIKEDIRFISNCVGKQNNGVDLIKKFEEEINQITAIGSTIANKKRIYFEIGALPYIYSFGSEVFLDEMIEIIGGINILYDQNGWIGPTEEIIIEANPEIILTNVNYIEDSVGEIKSRKGWEEVTAIENNQIYYIDNSSSTIPNHNIIKALHEMAKAVYPDEFAQID